MKKFIYILTGLLLALLSTPNLALADGGIFASGGGTKTAGQTFTVTVAASGASFDSLQGTINVSGPVDVVSFSAGSATWLPGKTPSNGGQFVGIVSERNSLTVATIKLRGRSPGAGSVSVSGVKLAAKGAVVATGSGGTNFTIQRAPELPSAPAITSTTHPDPNTEYEATTITLAWNKEAKVNGFAYLLDQSESTDPGTKITSDETTATFENKAIGTHYFHIKAHNVDGWSASTHFRINIKEPEAKINDQLKKPIIQSIVADSSFKNMISDGTVSGIVITGTTEPNYVANLMFEPAITLPEGKTLAATADAEGKFQYLIDFPIKAGSYSLTVQGQLEKILTPIGDPIRMEVSQAKGGNIAIITANDETKPVIPVVEKKWFEKMNWMAISIGMGALSLILLTLIVIVLVRNKKAWKTITKGMWNK